MLALPDLCRTLNLEWLKGEVPSGGVVVVVLHGVDPGESAVVSFQIKLPSKQVVSQALQCPFDGQALFFQSGIPGLTWLQLAAQIQDGVFLSRTPLGQYRSKADSQCIHLYQECPAEV